MRMRNVRMRNVRLEIGNPIIDKHFKLFLGLCLTVLSFFAISQPAVAQLPQTQIYIAPFNFSALTLKNPVPITTHKGYVNQPSFGPDTTTMLYVMDSDSATDVFRYTVATKTSAQVTFTKSAEFSPLSLPFNGGIIAVRVTKPHAEDEAYTESQELWHFSPMGNPNQVISEQHRVGYFTRFSDKSFAMFLVGNEKENIPHSLVWQNIGETDVHQVGYNIGRSLSQHPYTKQLTFVDKSDSTKWALNALGEDGNIQHLLDLPLQETRSTAPRSEDVCWLPNGTLLLSNGNKILHWNGNQGSALTTIYELKIKGGYIARMAINADATQIAFVVQHLQN